MLQSDDVMVHNIRVPDWSQKVWEVSCSGSFMDCDKTEEEFKENDYDIDYDQVPSLVNS